MTHFLAVTQTGQMSPSLRLVGPRTAETLRGLDAEFIIALTDNRDDVTEEERTICRECCIKATMFNGLDRLWSLSDLMIAGCGGMALWTTFGWEP